MHPLAPFAGEEHRQRLADADHQRQAQRLLTTQYWRKLTGSPTGSEALA